MNKKGFTLTEIIAVVVIIGIIIVIAIPVSRRLIVTNDQEKINDKERVVEKAMLTYAETDYSKYKCVKFTISDLINKGYVKDSDLCKYSDKSKAWYYYKGNILENIPDGVTCTLPESESENNHIDDNYEEIVDVPELDETILNDYVLTVTKTGTIYDVKPKITMKTGSPSNLYVTCSTSDSCTLENVPTGTAVSYTVEQKYYKVVTGYSLTGTIPSTESQATQTYEVKVQPKDIETVTDVAYTTNDWEVGIDITPNEDSLNHPYTFSVGGRILSASATGTVTTCMSSAVSLNGGRGYCKGTCRDSTDYIKLGSSTYLMNQKFAAGTPSPITAVFNSSVRKYDCHRTYSVSTKNYTFADALSTITISHNSVGGHSLKLSYTYLPE